MNFASAACRVVRATSSAKLQSRIRTTAITQAQCIRANSTFVRDAPPHTSQSSASASTGFPQRNQDQRAAPPRPEQKDGEEEKEEKRLRNPRNEEIKHRYVRFVNPETGALEPPTPLGDILRRVNRKVEYLELVKEKPEPIVKIQQTKTMYNRSKAKKLVQATKRAPEEKEVQLTWGVGLGDLQFKLRKVRDELEDGNRVNLVIAPKKGQKLPSPAEQQSMVEETLRLLEDVAKERKDRAVQKNAVGLFLESTRTKRIVELRWAQGDTDSWEGLKTAENALRQGERVEAVFHLPPPPKKKAEDAEAVAVDPTVAQERLERTLERLSELGKEWKPRDVRKGVVVAHLEGIKPS
ncbi:hypothetical protein PYCCODRAFT_1391215 [Trametes coccinea BRFM310]|uniref:Translation initiation factor 3 N-terminal domain-containing protein n=1 Tax=Trametes coccinea (strain BRFM310) TaxID=1353009 RepID=A0A1Y2IND2_TRAC3|nr:hypothetical protein PYCCODRAFT_1391215 [Trametes coccinea BRFM310]